MLLSERSVPKIEISKLPVVLGTRISEVPGTPSQEDPVQEITWQVDILQSRVNTVDVGEGSVDDEADILVGVVVGETDVVPLVGLEDFRVLGLLVNHDP